MHYYKRNLGDYAKKAGRLSMLQHGSYTLLIDSCYDREQFPTLEQAIEWTWASSTEEIEAVKFVLSKFFVLTADGTYVQDRILQELLDYQTKSDTNKRIANEREAKRKENSTNRVQSVNESSPNQEPRTKNHKPIKDKAIVETSFFEFWIAYPKKVAKQDAEKAFSKLNPDAELQAKILQAVANASKSPDWIKESGQFIPNAATWLNGKRWEDGLTLVQSPTAPVQYKNGDVLPNGLVWFNGRACA